MTTNGVSPSQNTACVPIVAKMASSPFSRLRVTDSPPRLTEDSIIVHLANWNTPGQVAADADVMDAGWENA